MFVFLIGLDAVALPEHWRVLAVLRVLVAGILLAAAQTSRLIIRPLYHRILGLAIIAVSAGFIEFMILRSGGHRSHYYVGMILLGVVAFGFLPGRIRFNIMAAGTVYGIYVVPIVLNERIVHVQEFATANFFLVTIFSAVVLLRHLYDQHLMSELSHHYELEQHRHHLEELVQARTGELETAIADLRKEIGERTKAEEQLQRAAEDLRQRNEELNGVLYSLAHDLRAPLVNIRGFTSELTANVQEAMSLLGGNGEPTDEERRQRAFHLFRQDVPTAGAFVRTAVDRISRQLDAMLHLFRISRRKMRHELVDLRSLVEDITRSLETRSGEEALSIELGPLPEITADQSALREMLLHLVDNARKYRDPGRPCRVRVWSDETATETVVHVSDNGRGVSREDEAKIFEMFRRVGQPTVPGEGMGLAYVKAYARRLGGQVWCDSIAGVGTTFHVAIPRQTTPVRQGQGA
jgi:signal transduction histidine kinase